MKKLLLVEQLFHQLQLIEEIFHFDRHKHTILENWIIYTTLLLVCHLLTVLDKPFVSITFNNNPA
jgi:hypothetical protein